MARPAAISSVPLADNRPMRHLIASLPHLLLTTWIGSVACCELDLSVPGGKPSPRAAA